MRSRNPVLLAVALLLAACGDTTEPRVPTTLELSEQTLSIERFDTVAVTATVLDQHGGSFTTIPEGYAVTWTSSAPHVVSVNDGRVAAVGAGSATVTAQAGNLPPVNLPVQVAPRTYSGQLSFNYAGHRSGSFAVSSSFRFQPSGDPNVPSFAFTTYEVEYDDQDIIAFRQRSDGLFDVLYFWVDQRVTVPGTRVITDGVLILGLGPTNFEHGYVVLSGTAQFSTASARRLVGTFTANLVHEVLGTALNITGGVFDLSVVPEAEFAPPGLSSTAASAGARQMLSPQQLYEVARAHAGRTLERAVP